jgi:hypothetical protein
MMLRVSLAPHTTSEFLFEQQCRYSVTYGRGLRADHPRFAPCLPRLAKKPPVQLHEIEHDGFRIITLRDTPKGQLTGAGHVADGGSRARALNMVAAMAGYELMAVV